MNRTSLAAADTAARVALWPTCRRPLNEAIGLMLFFVLFVGCNNYQPAPEPEAKTPPPAAEPAPAAKPAVQTATVMVPKKAAVGVGKKGHYGKGIIATPLGSLFAAEERINFEIQIPQAMKMFKALEGRAPKDTDEFMEKIIKPNRIRLPELPEGQRYWYDPKTEQLMVLVPEEE